MKEKKLSPAEKLLKRIVTYPGSNMVFSKGGADILRKKIEDIYLPLDYYEMNVIKMVYGLVDGFYYSLSDIARVFSLTPTNIREIEVRAIEKIRQLSLEYLLKE